MHSHSTPGTTGDGVEKDESAGAATDDNFSNDDGCPRDDDEDDGVDDLPGSAKPKAFDSPRIGTTKDRRLCRAL